jgi:hypothetical protein
VIFTKSTIFKNKIFSRSEVEIKEYFKTWVQNVTEQGYFDEEAQKEKRNKA